jgi:ferredoxin/flavodoxin
MIYYFSGTGNSLSTAKKLAEQLDDHIEMLSKTEITKVSASEKRVGFVFPVYCFDVPNFIKNFVRQLKFEAKPYIYAVVTCGGSAGNTLYNLNKLLEEQGQSLSYGASITLPDNTSQLLGAPYALSTLAMQDKTLNQITVELLANCTNMSEIKYSIKDKVIKIPTAFAVSTLSRSKCVDKNLCTSCGVCERVCSQHNIMPVIGKTCVDCLACIHWCPQAAINFKRRKLTKENHYHHPEVSLNEMLIK